MKSFGVLVLVGLLAVSSAGCSVQYVDDQGIRHIWGLNHVQIKEPGEDQRNVVAQQVSAFGLSFIRVPENQAFSLGYTRNFTLQVGDNTAGRLSLRESNPVNFSYNNLSDILAEYE